MKPFALLLFLYLCTVANASIIVPLATIREHTISVQKDSTEIYLEHRGVENEKSGFFTRLKNWFKKGVTKIKKAMVA